MPQLGADCGPVGDLRRWSYIAEPPLPAFAMTIDLTKDEIEFLLTRLGYDIEKAVDCRHYPINYNSFGASQYAQLVVDLADKLTKPLKEISPLIRRSPQRAPTRKNARSGRVEGAQGFVRMGNAVTERISSFIKYVE
jgi:hypothetical protein